MKVVSNDKHNKTERETSPWKCLYSHCQDRKLIDDAIYISARNCSRQYNAQLSVSYKEDTNVIQLVLNCITSNESWKVSLYIIYIIYEW